MAGYIVYTYLIDATNDFITDAEGDLIIIEERYVPARTSDYQRIGGQTGIERHGIKTFNIYPQEEDKWALRINQDTHIGIFPTQDAAYAALYGLFYYNDGHENDGFEAWIEKMLTQGGSSIVS